VNVTVVSWKALGGVVVVCACPRIGPQLIRITRQASEKIADFKFTVYLRSFLAYPNSSK
jgi:hypothetical protein